jgi:hypothetical protein
MIVLIGSSAPSLVLYAVSLVLVVWMVVDVVRRPQSTMALSRKAAWIAGSIVGWLFFGFIGAAIAIVYLVGPRRRMNAGRYETPHRMPRR